MIRWCLLTSLALAGTACASPGPLIVAVAGAPNRCLVSTDGKRVSLEPGDEGHWRSLAEAHGRTMIVDAEASTPWKCVAETTYRLQSWGWKAASVRIGGVPVPTR
jgi:hypothetical protein